MGDFEKEQRAGAASVAAFTPLPGQPSGIGPLSSGWTARGIPGLGGGARSRNGSPETRTPAGALVQLFTAPPDVWILPTTSHSGAVSTPLPLSSRAWLVHDESM